MDKQRPEPRWDGRETKNVSPTIQRLQPATATSRRTASTRPPHNQESHTCTTPTNFGASSGDLLPGREPQRREPASGSGHVREPGTTRGPDRGSAAVEYPFIVQVGAVDHEVSVGVMFVVDDVVLGDDGEDLFHISFS